MTDILEGDDLADVMRAANKDQAARKWAQGLIEQLPKSHDGRNSWLINHGVGDEADALRRKWEFDNDRPLPQSGRV